MNPSRNDWDFASIFRGKTKMSISRRKPAAAAGGKTRVIGIIKRLVQAHPDAKLDLNFTNPLELLVALILAAQARDDLVNEITLQLFKEKQTPANYATTPLEELEERIRKINFYRTKARAIQRCCRDLVERFNGAVPRRLEDLLSLPGVGRKTANILVGNAFGQDVIGVDTHVMRVSQRLALTRNTDPDKVEADLMAIIPAGKRVRFCHLLQYHGRRVCLAKRPDCPHCSIERLCPYPDKTIARSISSPR
jgi:endonuclease-3